MKNIVFTNATILDGTKDMVPYNSHVYIKNGKIETISKEEHFEEYEVVDVSGKYLMPGLINMHVHLAGNGKPQKKQRDNEKLVKMLFATPLRRSIVERMVEQFAKIELMSGVTTIRTVGGLKDLDTRTRDKILSGKINGPRILAANQGISVPGGHMAGSVAIACNSIEEAVALIEQNKKEGVDLIKLMITGGVMDAKEKGVPGQLKMSPEMVKACCEKAHELGFLVSAHVESTEGVRVALENGVDSIEHGALYDEDILRLFKEKNAFMICTISPGIPYAEFDRSIAHTSEVEQYNGKVVLKGFIEGTKAAIANDIPVGLGNDVGCPWISQYDFWRELVYFHNLIGISNSFALHTATLQNAILAGIGDVTGSIEEGKDADILITRKNPLENLTALRNVDMVMARGNLYDHPSVKRNAYVDKHLDPYLSLTKQTEF